MKLPYGETVTIWRRPSEADVQGDFPPAIVQSTITGCAFWPTTTAELVNGQDSVTWDASTLLPPDTDIKATDQIQIGDDASNLYSVVGQPQFWRNNFTGREPGYLVQLKAMRG